MYQLVVCTLVCVHTGEAFINQPGKCALQSRLRDTEGGGGVDADREPSEGRRKGSEKALQDGAHGIERWTWL